MDVKSLQVLVIELLAQHEELMSELYTEYSKKYDTYKLFWSDLSLEEKEHAKWIYKLLIDVRNGEILFNEGRFKIEAVQSSITYVENKKKDLSTHTISLIEALAVALSIENALLESKFFEVFESDSVKVKHIFTDLSEATTKHRKMVKEALEKERASIN